MRILVFLDTPRQTSYVDSVIQASHNIEGARVLAGGHGVSERYFGLANEAFEEQKAIPRRRWWRGSGLLKWAAPTLRQLCKTVIRFLQLVRRMTRRWLAGKAAGSAIRGFSTRLVNSVLKASMPFLSALAHRWRGFVIKTLNRIQNPTHSGIKAIVAVPAHLVLAVALGMALAANAPKILREMARYQLYFKQAQRMIAAANPDVVVVMEDNVEGFTGIVTRAARRAEIPFIILPDYIPNPKEPATYYSGSKSHQVRTLLDRVTALSQPKWVYCHNGVDLLRLPSVTIVAQRLLGCAPPAPWILNAGEAALIGLDSTAMHAHYYELGFHQSKLDIIGTAQDDRLHARFLDRQASRSELFKQLKLRPELPLVVCALPPDQYSSGDTSHFEYASYSALLKAWFADLAALVERANVVIRPHPRLKPAHLQAHALPELPITWMPTEDLVSVCDLYVASVSTTIRWALGLGIPVLNYDCYRYGYGDFSSARGIVECRDRADFSAALKHMLDTLPEAGEVALSDRGSWGRVDGQYSKRLAGLLTKVVRDQAAFSSTHETKAR